jgi:protein-disulfide isomerase
MLGSRNERKREKKLQRRLEKEGIEKKEKRTKVFGYVLFVAFLVVLGAFMFKGGTDYEDPNLPRAVLGNVESSVVVKEFSDLQCPACSSAHPGFKKIIEEYGDRVRFEFYHYPLRSLHPDAFIAAQGAECANDQGNFWGFIDLAYGKQQDLGKKTLIGIANSLSLDADLFEACLDSGAKKNDVQDDIVEGNRMNVRGTPSFFVNDLPLGNWGYNTFKLSLDTALANAN